MLILSMWSLGGPCDGSGTLPLRASRILDHRRLFALRRVVRHATRAMVSQCHSCSYARTRKLAQPSRNILLHCPAKITCATGFFRPTLRPDTQNIGGNLYGIPDRKRVGEATAYFKNNALPVAEGGIALSPDSPNHKIQPWRN